VRGQAARGHDDGAAPLHFPVMATTAWWRPGGAADLVAVQGGGARRRTDGGTAVARRDLEAPPNPRGSGRRHADLAVRCHGPARASRRRLRCHGPAGATAASAGRRASALPCVVLPAAAAAWFC